MQKLFVILLGVLLWRTPSIAQDFQPTAFPDRIILTWNGDPKTTQAVTWRTSEDMKAGKAQIVKANASPDLVTGSKMYDSKVEFLNVDGVRANYHSVTFTGLEPATTYAYRVGDEQHWSEWFHFKTAPKDNSAFSFIYFGDAQNNLKSMWSRVIRQAYSDMPKAAFMLHAGDLINRTHNDGEWGEWAHAGGFINAMVPSIVTPGNHEYNRDSAKNLQLDKHWTKQFTLPDNGPDQLKESVYYTDYGNLRVISLNSQEIVLNPASRVVQRAWLEKVLKENTSTWTVITFHHPIFSSKEGRDNVEFREAFKPLFDQYKVDLVLQGHDHTYGRGNNLPTGVPGKSKDNDGPVYVVSVSGPKMYDLTADRWMERAGSNTQLYQLITIDGNTLRYGAYTATGELYDSFDIIKKPGKPKKFIDKKADAIPENTEIPRDKKEKMTVEQINKYNKSHKRVN